MGIFSVDATTKTHRMAFVFCRASYGRQWLYCESFICDNRFSNKFLSRNGESWAALSIIEADTGLNLTLSQAFIELFLTLLETPPARIDRTSTAVILKAFISGSRVGSGCPRGHLVSRN